MMIAPRLRSIVLPAALVVLSAPFASAGYAIGDLRQYDLVVVNNLTSNSEVEGRTIIGGNINAGNTSNYGIKLSQAGYASTPDNLVVGGNINGPVNVNFGNVQVGGTAGNNVNGGNAVSGVTVSTNNANVQGVGASIQSTLNSASGYLSSLAANSTYSLNNSNNNFQNSPVTFNATPNSNGVAVFKIDGSILNGSSLGVQQYVLNAHGATSIVFDVTGGTANAPIVVSGNFNGGDFTNGSILKDVIWNFYQTTGSAVSAGLQFDTGFSGSVLAPSAYVSNSGSAINGSVMVSNFSQSAEVHYANGPTNGNIYQGVFLPGAVPEPASILSTFAGLLMAGGAAWRRRRRAA